MREPRRGTVLATFARSAYLDLEGSIVALVGEALLNGPLNVVLPEDTAPFERLASGGAVTASEAIIQPDGWPAISLRHAAPWDPRITPWTAAQLVNVIPQLRILADVVMAGGPVDHLAHPRIQEAVAALGSGLRARSPAEVTAAARGLAGLGSGLTPSGDDVLVGALIALAAIPDDQADLRNAIRDGAAGRTTRISETYLRSAARGEASEAWQRLLAALVNGSDGAVIAAGRRVRDFGETSGADMLTGFLLAMPALLEPTRPTQPTRATQLPAGPGGTSR